MPIILKPICETATRLAFLFTPMLEIRAVMQVPIFMPIIIGMAEEYVTVPVSDRA